MEQGNPLSTADGPVVDFQAICQQVRAALDACRIHAVSIHDETEGVLWLTQSSMGPDEHNAVREAFEAFTGPNGRPTFACDLGDMRTAVVFRAVNASRVMAGAIMTVLDSRDVPSGSDGHATLMNRKLQRVLADFATLRGSVTAPPVAPVRRSTIAELPKAGGISAVTPEIDRLHAALRRSPIALHVQSLVPLSKGSQLRRYEVLLRSGGEDATNSAPHAMLIGWLVHHPEVWRKKAVVFSVNLTKTAMLDEHFLKFVGLCLAKSALPQAMIGFEIDVATAVNLGAKTAEVAATLARLNCPLVLDDFGLRTECFDLLRLPAVRYVKLSPLLTAKMRTDKLSQAGITAVVQMARVLGMHTVAKHTENEAAREWLTALGVDFVQSNWLSPPVSIDSLLKSAPTAAAAPKP
jgi:EAL domain-containing protein (putative c-di-GMP-specific phosphodiesterase class I)